MDPIDDHTRLDAYAAMRRRANLAHEMWKPLAAGGIGAALTIAAVALAQPRFVFRDIEVPRVTYKDVTVPSISTTPVDIPVPRIVPAPETSAVAPRTPAEQRFENGGKWNDPSVAVKGRIVRPQGNGFIIASDAGELLFSPAKIGPDGKPTFDTRARSVVTAFIGDLCVCSLLSVGSYHCLALHNGVETEIPQVPLKGASAPVGKPVATPLQIEVRL